MDKQTLEQLIDKMGLDHVLQAISEICSEKADHIRASYSDKVLERQWRSASNAVDACSCNTAVITVGSGR